MRTIEKILIKAGYTKLELNNYIAREIVNGCGGRGGFNIGKFAKENIIYFPKLNTEKFKSFLEDLKYICCLHDIGYILGDTFLDKIKEDLKLAYRIYKLLYWTTLTKKTGAFIIVLSGVSLGGKKYFYAKEKYKLRLLISKIN